MKNTAVAFHDRRSARLPVPRGWLLPAALLLAAAGAPQLERLAVDPAVLAGGECLAPAYEGPGCRPVVPDGAENQTAEVLGRFKPEDRFILVADVPGLWARRDDVSDGSGSAQAADRCAPSARHRPDRIGCPPSKPQRRR